MTQVPGVDRGRDRVVLQVRRARVGERAWQRVRRLALLLGRRSADVRRRRPLGQPGRRVDRVEPRRPMDVAHSACQGPPGVAVRRLSRPDAARCRRRSTSRRSHVRQRLHRLRRAGRTALWTALRGTSSRRFGRVEAILRVGGARKPPPPSLIDHDIDMTCSITATVDWHGQAHLPVSLINST